jgi:hypothetical protein
MPFLFPKKTIISPLKQFVQESLQDLLITLRHQNGILILLSSLTRSEVISKYVLASRYCMQRCMERSFEQTLQIRLSKLPRRISCQWYDNIMTSARSKHALAGNRPEWLRYHLSQIQTFDALSLMLPPGIAPSQLVRGYRPSLPDIG